MPPSRAKQQEEELLTSNFCIVCNACAADPIVGYGCCLSCTARPVPGGQTQEIHPWGGGLGGWHGCAPSTGGDFHAEPEDKTHRFSSQASYLGWGSGSLLLKS